MAETGGSLVSSRPARLCGETLSRGGVGNIEAVFLKRDIFGLSLCAEVASSLSGLFRPITSPAPSIAGLLSVTQPLSGGLQ